MHDGGETKAEQEEGPHVAGHHDLQQDREADELHHATSGGQTSVEPCGDGGDDSLAGGEATDEEQGDDRGEDEAEDDLGHDGQLGDGLGVSLHSRGAEGLHHRGTKGEEQGHTVLAEQGERNRGRNGDVGIHIEGAGKDGCHNATNNSVRRLSTTNGHVTNGHELVGTTNHEAGLHIAEDQFYCEIIDPETLEVLPDGEVGELVITTLTRECSPMIRYRTRDVTTINAEPCACGRTHRKIGRLLGRTDDMLIIRGVNVFPSQIEQVITEFPEIATQYQIILTMNGPLDHVELQVETEPDFPIDEVRRLEDLRNRLAAALKSNLQVAVDIKFVEPKTIARSEGKAKRVIDLRGENQ